MFVRVGAALMLLPGFGEPAVTPRLRLLLGLLIALLVTPLLDGQLPRIISIIRSAKARAAMDGPVDPPPAPRQSRVP